MENITFQTPSGHTVTIKPTLNYPEKRRVQRVYMSAGKLDSQTGEPTFDLGVQVDAQDTLIKIMIRRIQLASGRIFEGTESVVFSAMSEIDDLDIQAIYDKLDELTKDLNIFPTAQRGEKERQQTLELFQFHRVGRGVLPPDYEDIYVCDLLHLTETEYLQQSATWVERMIVWHTQKAKAQELASKEAQRKAKR